MAHSPQEQPSTYVVQDRNNEDEMRRLDIQDQMMTESMGGVLCEQEDPARFQRILDVGCGTGSWLIEVAKAFPQAQDLIGIDISQRMLKFARDQAIARQIGEKVLFQQMDALRTLEFPSAFFDLVNQRFGIGYLRTWDWPKLLLEFCRVIRPGGILRLTETSVQTSSTSDALDHLSSLLCKALQQAGHFFSPEGVVDELESLMRRFSSQVHTHTYPVEIKAGTVRWQQCYDDMRLLFLNNKPFLQKWSHVPSNYDALYQQALQEMRDPNFVANGFLLTVWGEIH